jgi:AraC-like DNA-binding protein
MKKLKPEFHILLSHFSKDGGNIIVKLDTFTPSVFPLHTHNFFEIELVIKGEGTQIINGHKYKMQPGLFYFLSPTDSHQVYYTTQTKIINLSFSHNILPETFETFLANKQNELLFYTEGFEFQLLSQLFQAAYTEFQNKSEHFETALINYLSIILLSVVRKSNIPLTGTPHNDTIEQAISYIKLHFTENPSLDRIAKYVHLTPSHLTTIIKKQTGLSYVEYLTKLKISYAKKLLKSNQHSITDIVFTCGFNSICNFNRVFKQKTGLSPSQYKKKHANAQN